MLETLKLVAVLAVFLLTLYRLRQLTRIPELRNAAMIVGVSYATMVALFLALAFAYAPGTGMEKLSALARGLPLIMFLLFSALCIIGPSSMRRG